MPGTTAVAKHSSTGPLVIDNAGVSHMDISIPIAANNFATGQTSCPTASAVPVVAARPTRREVIITNTDTTHNLYVGGTTAVTIATGHLLTPSAQATFRTAAGIWAVANTAAITASYADSYD